ncbi:MAG: hypothetical protein GF346_12220 [Candidatus Eisenbacteria bacterium]|nr:hypothetical protein [Candidatus Latescibacterota bacterium]MBD3303201.1 hypothetical protein [Candidatus Eisenbacteria bacterium]
MPEKIQRKRAVVVSNEPLASDIHELVLRPEAPDGEPFRAGQHLWIEIDPETRRPYSIASPPSRPREIELILNRVPHGPVSNYLANLRPGNRVVYSGPTGSFHVDVATPNDLLFVASGTGLAPLRSMILDLIERRVERRIDLVFGTRRRRDLIHPEEFRHLESHRANFRYHPCLSRFGDEDWSGHRGRVTAVLPQLFTDLRRTDAYICGRPEMVEDTIRVLLRLGIDRAACHREGG